MRAFAISRYNAVTGNPQWTENFDKEVTISAPKRVKRLYGPIEDANVRKKKALAFRTNNEPKPEIKPRFISVPRSLANRKSTVSVET